MTVKRENKPKIKKWSKTIKKIERSELAQAKKKSRSFVDISTKDAQEEFEDSQYQIDSVVSRIDKMKKIVGLLRREKKKS